MSIKNIRKEVMLTLEKSMQSFMDTYLIPAEKIWQPTDFLPNSQKDSFITEVEEIREISKELHDDFWVVLVGDTITWHCTNICFSMTSNLLFLKLLPSAKVSTNEFFIASPPTIGAKELEITRTASSVNSPETPGASPKPQRPIKLSVDPDISVLASKVVTTSFVVVSLQPIKNKKVNKRLVLISLFIII